MNQILDKLTWLVTARPYVTLAVLLVVTVVLAAGASLRGELSETEGFLPPDSAIAQAIDDARTVPEIQAGIDAITGIDADGTPVALATIRLLEADVEQRQQAERRIRAGPRGGRPAAREQRVTDGGGG